MMQPELLDSLYGHAFRYLQHPDVALSMVVPGVLSWNGALAPFLRSG